MIQNDNDDDQLRIELAYAHRLTALYDLDQLNFNHISVRTSDKESKSFFITSGNISNTIIHDIYTNI
jgi:ribulose-5-phosphate 4-epimerase/fuculose-1-phosphate aldolase